MKKLIMLLVFITVIQNSMAVEAQAEPVQIFVKIGETSQVVSDTFVKNSRFIQDFLEEMPQDQQTQAAKKIEIPLSKVKSTKTISTIESLLQAPDQKSLDALIQKLSNDQLVQLLLALEYLDIADLLRQGLSFFAGKEFSADLFKKFIALPTTIREEIWQQSTLYAWYSKQLIQKNLEIPALAWNIEEISRIFTKDNRYLIILEPGLVEIVDLVSMTRTYKQLLDTIPMTMQVSQGEKYIFLNQNESSQSNYASYIIPATATSMLRLKNEKVESIVNDFAVLYQTAIQEDALYVTYIQNLANSKEQRLRIAEKTEPSQAVLSGDTKWIAVGLPDEDSIKVYTLSNLRNQVYDTFTTLNHVNFTKMVTTNDSKYILSLSDSEVKLWSPLDGQSLMTVSQAGVDIVQVAENSNYAVTASTSSGTIWVWDLDAKKVVKTYNHKGLNSIKAFTKNMVMSKAINNGVAEIKLWDISFAAAQAVETLEDYGAVELVNDKYVVLSDVVKVVPGGQEHPVVKCLIYDVDNLETPWYEIQSDQPLTVGDKVLFIDGIAVSMDGIIALVDSEDGDFVLVAPDEEQIATQTNVSVDTIQFSPDGKILIAYHQGAIDTISLWKIDSGLIDNVNDFTVNQLQILMGYYQATIHQQKYTMPSTLWTDYNALPEQLRTIIKSS